MEQTGKEMQGTEFNVLGNEKLRKNSGLPVTWAYIIPLNLGTPPRIERQTM